MSRFDDFDQYVLSLNPVLYLPLILGNVNRRDSAGGAASLTNGVGYWVRTDKGWGYRPIDDGRLTVPDSAALRITTGSLFFASPSFRFARDGENFPRLFCKRDAGGNHFEVLFSTTYVGVFPSAGNSITTVDIRGKKTLGITIQSGSGSEFFYDGMSVGTGGVINIVSDDADIVVSNYYTTGSNELHFPLEALIMFNTVLTDQQFADLHLLWERVEIATHTSKISLPGNYPVISNEVLRLTGDTQNMKALDLSGNGIDFNFATCKYTENETPRGKPGLKGFGGTSGEAYLSVTDSRLDDVIPFSCAFWVNAVDNGESGSGRLYNKAGTLLAVYSTTSGAAFRLNFADRWNGGVLTSWYYDLMYGQWVHASINYTGQSGEKPQISINGAPFVDMNNVAPAGTRDSDAGTAYLLDTSSTNREFNGTVTDFQLFNKILTDTEARNIYLRAAKRAKRLAHATEYPVSLVNVTSGFVGPWEIYAGTWQWRTNQQIYCAAVGVGGVYTSSKQAYGGWYFEFTKADASSFEFLPITTSRARWNASDNNGYLFLINTAEVYALYRITGGALTAVFSGSGTITADTLMKCFITRNSDGEFNFYFKGGVYSSWTKTDTGTDNTHATSLYTSFACSTAALSSTQKYTFLPYGMTLDPTTDDLSFLEGA